MNEHKENFTKKLNGVINQCQKIEDNMNSDIVSECNDAKKALYESMHILWKFAEEKNKSHDSNATRIFRLLRNTHHPLFTDMVSDIHSGDMDAAAKKCNDAKNRLSRAMRLFDGFSKERNENTTPKKPPSRDEMSEIRAVIKKRFQQRVNKIQERDQEGHLSDLGEQVLEKLSGLIIAEMNNLYNSQNANPSSITADKISPECRFGDDLDFHSIDDPNKTGGSPYLEELLLIIEEEFNIEIEDDERKKIITVGDVIKMIVHKFENADPSNPPVIHNNDRDEGR